MLGINQYLFQSFYIYLLERSKQLISSPIVLDWCPSSKDTIVSVVPPVFLLIISDQSEFLLGSIRRLLNSILSIQFFSYGVLGVWVHKSSNTASSKCQFRSIRSGVFLWSNQQLLASFLVDLIKKLKTTFKVFLFIKRIILFLAYYIDCKNYVDGTNSPYLLYIGNKYLYV